MIAAIVSIALATASCSAAGTGTGAAGATRKAIPGKPLSIPKITDTRVIYDSGQAISAMDYLRPAFARLERSERKANSEAAAKALAKSRPLLQLPIRTSMQLGKITPHEREGYDPQHPLGVAFFMLGSDEHSIGWLKANRDALEKLGAMGMLIQADSEEDVQRVLEEAGNLAILPVGGDVIASHYQLTRYPVLVTNRTVEQ